MSGLPCRIWLLASSVCITSARTATAQMARASPATSTLSGVYTARQADRGREDYAGMCTSCHSPASHSGATFEKWWKGRTLGDLFGYLSTQMPKNDPGSLSPEQYADVVAYLLKMNAMPIGTAELLPDSVALAVVRIELPRKASRKAPVRRRKPHPTSPRKGV